MKFSELDTRDTNRWLTKMHENTTLRRRVMFRIVAQSVQTLILGNAGGVALALSIKPTEQQSLHWLILANILFFIIGLLIGAITQLLLATVAVKEAHAADEVMAKFINEEMTTREIAVFVEKTAYRWANTAGICGVFSALFFVFGAISGIVILAIYF